MNIYIMVDLEGINGIYNREQLLETRELPDEGRDYITREVNACADACKEAGAERVYVRDAHSTGQMIRWDKLSPSVDYLIRGGAGHKTRFAGVEDCDGVILLGYHAMSNTEGSVLSHTMSPEFHYFFNGVEHGEIGIDAAFAGERGKPIIMVSGCDFACAEAKRFLPWVTTCVTKKALGHNQAVLDSPARGLENIRKTTIEAIRRMNDCELYLLEKPIAFRRVIPSGTLEKTIDTVNDCIGP